MPKKIASKMDWIKLGEKNFSTGGKEALVVESMSLTLKVSKTSFYWHFKSKELFLEELIEHWRKTHTSDFIADAEQATTPKKQLKALLLYCFTDLSMKDFLYNLRSLARRNKKYKDILIETEQKRIAYFEIILSRNGIPDRKCPLLAEAIYNYYLGWYERNKYEKVDKSAREPLKVISELTGLRIR